MLDPNLEKVERFNARTYAGQKSKATKSRKHPHDKKLFCSQSTQCGLAALRQRMQSQCPAHDTRIAIPDRLTPPKNWAYLAVSGKDCRAQGSALQQAHHAI